MALDLTDPEQVGERAAARAEAWLEVQFAALLDEALEGMPAAWRRDPYWQAVAREWALHDVTRDLQLLQEQDPAFINRFLHDA